MRPAALAVIALAACGREHRDATPVPTDQSARAYAQLVRRIAPPGLQARVSLAGKVIDANDRGVPNIEVIARGRQRASTRSGADGSFQFSLPPGTYGLYVDDERYLSSAARRPARIHGVPRAVTAGALDEALVTRLELTTSIANIDVPVVRSVRVHGAVKDPMNAELGNAVVRATCDQRPVLGTDVATSDANGRYELRLPAGQRCVLDATHDKYAGIVGDGAIALGVDAEVEHDVIMKEGCIVTGRVLDARGEPAGDGAIEELISGINGEFRPGGEIAPDGTFRWVSTHVDHEIAVRAWPWRSPPAAARTFTCREGMIVTDVVFRLPAMTADLDGVLVDRAGEPVPFAFIDLAPRSPSGIGQQERTDAQGRWQFHDVPAGPYALRAHVSGRGMVASSIMAPQTDSERLVLGGTARLTGTTTFLVDGSFEITELTCKDFANDQLRIEEPPRMVPVVASAFSLSGLPACKVVGRARWRSQAVGFEADLTAGGGATVELDLGTPRPKRVYGIVRDENGEPVANVVVASRAKASADELTRTDDDGHYSLTATPGAFVHAKLRARSAERQVGAANVDEERVDLVLRAP
ncbi:MAG: carboxypeptidase-like regulatory domain-containing protein [Kofleriaceae bacterium]|nr:carboxypeptidase-like regulatory domain-containing protein [Kofleriaceae bacterium]